MGHCRITKVFIRRKMNNNPTISIITPVYNVSKYLDRCIESIINQTFDNFELILIDDGSTDDSGKKCDDWAIKDSRIKVIHQRNAGADASPFLSFLSAGSCTSIVPSMESFFMV